VSLPVASVLSPRTLIRGDATQELVAGSRRQVPLGHLRARQRVWI
jgi:hypothetical protein